MGSYAKAAQLNYNGSDDSTVIGIAKNHYVDVFIRKQLHEPSFILCICLSWYDNPLTPSGPWKKVGHNEIYQNFMVGENLKIYVASNYRNACNTNSYIGSIQVPDIYQSIASTFRCTTIDRFCTEGRGLSNIVLRRSKSLSNEEFLIRTEFESNDLVKQEIWNINGLYELANLYGIFGSPSRWHKFASKLGFTPSEIKSLQEALDKSGDFHKDPDYLQSPITPRRIFSVLISAYQRCGGTLSAFARTIHHTNTYRESFGSKSTIFQDAPHSKVITKCAHLRLHPTISPTLSHWNNHEYGHYTSSESKSEVEQDNWVNLRLEENSPITNPYPMNHKNDFEKPGDFTLHRERKCINRSWIREARRSRSKFGNIEHVPRLEIDNTEPRTPIKRIMQPTDLPEAKILNSPAKRQRLNTISNQTPIQLPKVEIKKSDRYRQLKSPYRRFRKRPLQNKLGNQVLLPQLWKPSISPVENSTSLTQNLLDSVQTRLEETKRQNEMLQSNLNSFLQQLCKTTHKSDSFIPNHSDLIDGISNLNGNSKHNLNSNNIWKLAQLFDHLSAPSLQDLIKLLGLKNTDSRRSSQNVSILEFIGQKNRRISIYLILLRWIELDNTTSQTFEGLKRILTNERFHEFAEHMETNWRV